MMAHMGGAGSVSFPQCIHVMVKAAIILKETLLVILYLLLCFFVSLFSIHSLSLSVLLPISFAIPLRYVIVRQWDYLHKTVLSTQ